MSDKASKAAAARDPAASNVRTISGKSKIAVYGSLRDSLRQLIADQTDFLANISNFAALLFSGLPNLNWAGFYLLRGSDLVLGPFQGKPACSCIAMGDGVCGTAALQRAAVLVPNVHAFPGHIACDTASNSEIVVPLIRNRRVLGVLDIDSPSLDRFAEADRVGCEAVAALYLRSLDA